MSNLAGGTHPLVKILVLIGACGCQMRVEYQKLNQVAAVDFLMFNSITHNEKSWQNGPDHAILFHFWLKDLMQKRRYPNSERVAPTWYEQDSDNDTSNLLL